MSKLSEQKWFRALFRRRIFIALLLVAQLIFLYFLIESGSKLSGIVSLILTLISFLTVLYVIRRRDKGAYKLMWVILILTMPIFGGLFYIITQVQTAFPNFKASGELGQKSQRNFFFLKTAVLKKPAPLCRSMRRRFVILTILPNSPFTPKARQNIFLRVKKCSKRF